MQASTRFDGRAHEPATGGGAVADLDDLDMEVLRSVQAGSAPASASAERAREWTRSLERMVRAGHVGPAAASVEPPPSTPVLRPHRQALRDPELDEQLRTRGYVTVRLISTELAAELREAYGEVHGWDGEGFEPDPGNPDAEYRRRSRAVLGQALDGELAKLFDDYSPFLQGYYCKWPDTPETHLHADWTNVDEHLGHRSYIVWCALQDIEADSGQMAVLPGSHAIDGAPRGSNLNLPLTAAWEGNEERIWERMVRVPLRAGEAMVFDMGLIHASYTNSTELPRVAAVTCLRPNEAELVYYRGVTGDRALKYRIDEEFFLELTPAALVDELPLRVPSAVVDVTPSAVARQAAHQVLDPVTDPRPRSGLSLSAVLRKLRRGRPG